MGDGSTVNRAIPVTVASVSGVSSVSCGASHTCVVLTDGTVRCFGSNSDGQLGDNSTTTRAVPTTVLLLANIASVSCGGLHTCAVNFTGAAFCFGKNSLGQLGDDSHVSRLVPVAVAGAASGVQEARAGGEGELGNIGTTCLLLRNGSVSCFGDKSAT